MFFLFISGDVRREGGQTDRVNSQVRHELQGRARLRPHKGGAAHLLRQPHDRRGLQHNVPRHCRRSTQFSHTRVLRDHGKIYLSGKASSLFHTPQWLQRRSSCLLLLEDTNHAERNVVFSRPLPGMKTPFVPYKIASNMIGKLEFS